MLLSVASIKLKELTWEDWVWACIGTDPQEYRAGRASVCNALSGGVV